MHLLHVGGQWYRLCAGLQLARSGSQHVLVNVSTHGLHAQYFVTCESWAWKPGNEATLYLV